MNMVRSSVRQKGKTYSYYMCLENRTRKTCSSHRISVKKLEETVLQVLTLHVNNLIDDERISEYIKSLPDQYDELEQTNILINQKMSEIERYIRLKSKLKGALADGLIDKTEYDSFEHSYDERQRQAEVTVAKLKSMHNSVSENAGDSGWLEQFRQHSSISELTRPLVLMFIERIIVYEDRQIEVQFKYECGKE